MMVEEALAAADEVIEALKKKGLDYSSKRDEIALAFDEGLLEGNDTEVVSFEDTEFKDLRIIQEDHYDQHMDEDEDKPEWGSMLCYVAAVPSYVWLC
jgi:hypothetical protein